MPNQPVLPIVDSSTTARAQPPKYQNGYLFTYSSPYQWNCGQWMRILFAKNGFNFIKTILQLVLLLAVTPLYVPLMIFLFYNVHTHTNCKHERVDVVSKWLYNYTNMFFDFNTTGFWKLVLMKFASITGLLAILKPGSAYLANSDMHIVSFLGATLGAQTKVRCWWDFRFFLPRMLSYKLHEYECMQRIDYPMLKNFPESVPMSEPSEIECRAAILHNLWGSMAYQCFPVVDETGQPKVGEWQVDFPDFVNAHYWCKMNCAKIRIKYLPAVTEARKMSSEEVLEHLSTNPTDIDIQDWEISVVLKSKKQKEEFFRAETENHKGSGQILTTEESAMTNRIWGTMYSTDTFIAPQSDLYALRCAVQRIAVALPTIWHSWVHFPTEDLIAVWVAQKQAKKETDSTFFKIARIHSIGSMYNAQLLKETGRPSNSTFDPESPESSKCTVFISNKDSTLYNIGVAFIKEMASTRPAAMGSSPTLPYIKFMQDAMRSFEVFVSKAWTPFIEKEANEFVDWVNMVTRGQMDFRKSLEERQGFIVRVLWSQTLHFMDHSCTSAIASKFPCTSATITPEMLSEDFLFGDNWDWIVGRIKKSQCKHDNFSRMFADYSYQPNTTRTVETFDYGIDGEMRNLQEELKSELKKVIQGPLCRHIGLLFKGYVDPERLGKYAPVSIDH